MDIKTIKSEKALTLSELLVSVILIGIVMMGVMSFNFTIKSIEDTSSKASKASLQAAAAMTMIKKDAELATGDATNHGIVWDTTNNDSICFRYDCTNPDAMTETYTDDCWFCYWLNNNDLNRCQLPLALVPPPIVPVFPFLDTSCAANTTVNLATLSTPANFFTVNFLPMSEGYDRIQSIDLTINCKDNPNDATVDPLNNPEQIFSTRVTPISHSQ